MHVRQQATRPCWLGRGGWCLDSLPCTCAKINPSNTKARRTKPQLLLKSMRLFTVPVSCGFHPFKREAGLAVTSEHHPGNSSPWFSSTVHSSPASFPAVPILIGLEYTKIPCFIHSNLQLPRWAETSAMQNAPPGDFHHRTTIPYSSRSPEEGNGLMDPHSNTPAR